MKKVFLSLSLVTGCGTDRVDNANQDERISSDIDAKDAAYFQFRLGSDWWTTAKKPEEKPNEELFAFVSGSSASAGLMKYATSDASGEWSYELVSRKQFSWNESEWVAWIFKNGLIKTRVSYGIVCHPKNSEEASVRYYPYEFQNIADCFDGSSKELILRR